MVECPLLEDNRLEGFPPSVTSGSIRNLVAGQGTVRSRGLTKANGRRVLGKRNRRESGRNMLSEAGLLVGIEVARGQMECLRRHPQKKEGHESLGKYGRSGQMLFLLLGDGSWTWHQPVGAHSLFTTSYSLRGVIFEPWFPVDDIRGFASPLSSSWSIPRPWFDARCASNRAFWD